MSYVNNGKLKYMNIVQHYEDCFRQYGDCSKGVDWPNEIDAEKRYRVMMELMDFDKIHFATNETISVMDFGCGLGNLYSFIKGKESKFNYTGIDISDIFVKTCKKKYPEGHFIKMDILTADIEYEGQYDYIFANGVFTEKCELTFEEMFCYVRRMLCKLYKMCRYGIAFNVMSKDVDWERDDLFHLPLNDLSRFLAQEITRDYIIRNDYGLYEYTVYVYKRRV